MFRYPHGFYLLPILARILSFSGTDPDSAIFRYWFEQFFGTRIDSTFPGTRPDSIILRYWPWFYHFSVLVRTVSRLPHRFSLFLDSRGLYCFPVQTLILPFFGTRSDSFSVLARILPFPGTRPDSIVFRYRPWFYHFSVLIRRVFRFSYRFYLFPVISQILPFFGTHTDWTLFRDRKSVV